MATIPYQYAGILCELLRGQPCGKPYRLSGVYVEFENNGGAAVTPPSPTRDEGRNYYAALAGDPIRDYLRVPITAITLDSTDDELFPDGNRLTCIAATSGTAGVNGKTFSDAVSSRVYGGALVATPDWDDPTQDLVMLRFYYDADNQLVKQSGSQIVINQPLEFN